MQSVLGSFVAAIAATGGLTAPTYIGTRYKGERGKRRFTRDTSGIGRNDPCSCGSGKKFKKCCMGKASEEATQADEAIPDEAEARQDQAQDPPQASPSNSEGE